MSIDEDFILAAENGYLDTVADLISQGANIHVQENQAFIYAAGEGHLDMVKYLVSLGADIHAQGDEALLWSSRWGQLYVVMYLVSRGANIHARNDKAFADAEWNGHGDVVEFLSDMSGKDYVSPALQFEETKHKASRDVFIENLPLGSLIYNYYIHLSPRDG